MSIDLFTRYKTITCCHENCYVSFVMTEEFFNQKLKDKTVFYCPNGHSQYFIGETEAQKLKHEAQKLKHEVVRLVKKIESVRSCKRRIEYSRRHWKGEVTKLKRKEAKCERDS